MDPQSNSSRQPSSPQPAGYLFREDGVCPICGSHNCEIQVQHNVSTSGSNFSCCNAGLGAICMGPFGLLCGLCGTGSKTTTTHKSMWVCKDCGNQFPVKKDMFSDFVGATVSANLFGSLFFGFTLIFITSAPLPITLILLGIVLFFEYLNHIICKKAMGTLQDWTEEDIANGPLPALNLKFYRAAKPLLPFFARRPMKCDVVSGVLTTEQVRMYSVLNMLAVLAGLALGICPALLLSL